VFDWLFEGRLSVYLLLIALGAIVVILWARTGFAFFRTVGPASRARRDTVPLGSRHGHPRRRPALLPILLALIAILIGVYYLLDRLVETRREQIKRKLQEMAAAVKARDVDRIFKHVSEQFDVQGMNRAAFGRYVGTAINRGLVDDLVIWGEQFPDDSGRVSFFAKPKGPRLQETQFSVRSHFVLDPDGQWRLQGFEVFFGLGGDPLNLPSQE
jgi:hypothetical protein